MSQYAVLRKPMYKEGEFTLRPIFEVDIESIRKMRNAQIDILRQNQAISPEEQKRYYNEVIAPSMQEDAPKQILLAINQDNHLLGYAGLVHIDWDSRRAEISFIIKPEFPEGSEEFRTIFNAVYTMLDRIAFSELLLNKLTAEVYEIRPQMMHLLQRKGFSHEGTLHQHVLKGNRFLDAHLFARYNIHQKHNAICVTSISKKVPLLHQVRDAMLDSDTFGTLIGFDSDLHVIGKYFVDHFITTHETTSTDPHLVLKLCKEHHIKAIIPTRDAELLFFAKAKQLFQNAGISILISSVESIQKAQDKLLFFEEMKKANLPAIPSYNHLGACTEERLVIKEQHAAAPHLSHVNISKEHIIEVLPLYSQPIFQPYIEGKEYSIDLYRDKAGQFQTTVARSRDWIVSGESQVTTIVHNDALTGLAQKVAVALDLYGPAVVQVIVDKEGNFHILECNMRFGGASTAACNAGHNAFSYFLSEIEGREFFHERRASFTQIRHLHDSLQYDY